jgi:hypothetical protein
VLISISKSAESAQLAWKKLMSDFMSIYFNIKHLIYLKKQSEGKDN